MCENRVTRSIGITSAYKWQAIEGCEKPTTGTEIHNELLAAALLQKVDFNNAELSGGPKRSHSITRRDLHASRQGNLFSSLGKSTRVAHTRTF